MPKQMIILLIFIMFFAVDLHAQPYNYSEPFNRAMDGFNQANQQRLQNAIQMEQLKMQRERQEAEIRSLQAQEDLRRRQIEAQEEQKKSQAEKINVDQYLKGDIGAFMFANLIMTESALGYAVDLLATGGGKMYKDSNYLMNTINGYAGYCSNTRERIKKMLNSGVYVGTEIETLDEYLKMYGILEDQARSAHEFFVKNEEKYIKSYFDNKKIFNAKLSVMMEPVR